MQNEIAIIDFGGQYTHLIARRIRNLGIFSEIYHPENFHYNSRIKGIIFSGGPQSVNASDAFKIEIPLSDIPVPVLGICYGHQLIAHIIGGKIESGSNKEYGYTLVDCILDSPLFAHTAKNQQVWMSHGDHVVELPEGFVITASTADLPVAAFQSIKGDIFGVQFHPEVSHTFFGNQILKNFLLLCTETFTWEAKNYKDKLINEVKKAAGNHELLILLSGGVDSLVAMELCLVAIGSPRIHAIHIDTGFMRLHESENIIKHLQEMGYKNLRLIRAEDRFLDALKDVYDPEEKRLIIGKLFAEIADEAIADFKEKDLLLVQGTIYPDTIESGASKKSAKIKTHHNRVYEIEKMIAEGRIIEPVKDLYKDEVRNLGIELGIPSELVQRHPFPGPGLAIRILASPADKIEPSLTDEADKLQQLAIDKVLFTQLLPIKSVGVMGDFRTYNHPVLFTYKNHSHCWKTLRNAARIVINNMGTVNRALYATGDERKEYFMGKNSLNKNACDQLRVVDHILMREVAHLKDIWQMPVVQLPLFDSRKRQVYVMRPVTSLDAMTADFYEMDYEFLIVLIKKIKQIPFVADLLYDITSKPPATIEWE
jgi:GMP synthase (glutamine-hydrolysing)